MDNKKIKAVQINERFLCCPECGEENLHQIKCNVVEPDEEDSKSGLEVTVMSGIGNYFLKNHDSKIDGEKAKEANYPKIEINSNTIVSSRRNSTLIEFSCEHCDHISKLLITQNKGNTIISFE